MKHRSLVYVAGKYTAATEREIQENVELAKTIGLLLRQFGVEAIVPHIAVLPPIESDPRIAWKIAMRTCVAMLLRCDAVLLAPNWRESRGARVERWIALKRGIPVFERIPDMLQ